MPSYDDHSAYGSSHGCSGCSEYSVTRGKAISESPSSGECISYSYSIADTPSRSSMGDPATIARCIFHDQLLDALVVLKNCGALRLAEEREWCVAELQRLLLELFTNDMA
jgi:hypothetical protein